MEATLFETSVYQQLEAAQARIQMLEADLNQLLGIQPTYSATHSSYRADEATGEVSAVLESAPIALYTLNWDGTVTFAQGRAFAEIGVRSEQVIGANIFHLFHNDIPVIEAHHEALNGSPARYTTTLMERTFDAWLMPTQSGVVGVVVETI